MKVIIGNFFDIDSGTQVHFSAAGADEVSLNPEQEIAGLESPEIAQDQELAIRADDSCCLSFQMGPSTDFTLQLQKNGNQWILKNTTGNTEVQVRIGPDGQ